MIAQLIFFTVVMPKASPDAGFETVITLPEMAKVAESARIFVGCDSSTTRILAVVVKVLGTVQV